MGSNRLLPVILGLALGAVALFFVLRSGGGPEATAGVERTAQPSDAQPAAPADLRAPEQVQEEEAAAPVRPRGERVAAESTAHEEPAPRAAKKRPGPLLRGRVVDPSGRPLAGAEVRASDAGPSLAIVIGRGGQVDDEPDAVTAEDGVFEVEGLEPGRLRVSVREAGFAPLDQGNLSLPDVEVHDLGDLVLTPGALLSGRVVDADGAGVAGARLVPMAADDGMVMISTRTARPLAVTDEQGRFRVEHLACGPWKLLVKADLHPPKIFRGEANEPGREVSGLRFELPEAASISGRVVSEREVDFTELVVRATPGGGMGAFAMGADGAAQDALVEQMAGGPYEAECAADGSFEIPGLTKGSKYGLRVTPASTPQIFAMGAMMGTTSTVAEAGDRGVELEYAPRGTLSFQVVDGDTGDPIEEFVVRTGGRFGMMARRNGEGRADREHPGGVASLEDLPTDRGFDLEVEAQGYATWRLEDLTLAAGEVRDLGKVRLDPVALLLVRVVDDSSGDPVEGARVRLQRARQGDLDSAAMAIRIDEEDEDGPVFAGAEGGRGRTDENGEVVLTSLEGELCTLEVQSKYHAKWRRDDLVLPRGEDHEVDVRLVQGGTVVVTAFDRQGEPMSGARVLHEAPGAGSNALEMDFVMGMGANTVVTDGAGRAVFDHLAAGEHGFKLSGQDDDLSWGGGTVRIRRDSNGPAPPQDDTWTRIAVVEGGEHELSLFASPLGTLEGRVREAGLPLAGATVELREAELDDGGGGGGASDPLRMFADGPRAQTDGEGRYRIEDVEAGRYTLTVTHPSRSMPAQTPVTIREGRNEENVELALSVIAGHVLDPEGEPLAGVRVEARRAPEEGEDVQVVRMISVFAGSDGETSMSFSDSGSAKPVFTDEDGAYVLSGVTPDVDLLVEASGDAIQTTTSDRVRVGANQERTGLDLEAPPAGRIKIEVFDATGKPASFVMIEARRAGAEDPDDREVNFTNATGEVSFGGLVPGAWTLEASRLEGLPGADDEDAPPVTTTVEVVAGKTVETRMDLP